MDDKESGFKIRVRKLFVVWSCHFVRIWISVKNWRQWVWAADGVAVRCCAMRSVYSHIHI